MKLMRYVGPANDLTGRRFYVVDRPTMLGVVRARYERAAPDAWYDFNADEFEEIEQENT
jgi:hypothetical protein